MEMIENLGIYNVSWRILHTTDHGLPQHRDRLFIVGIKKFKQVQLIRKKSVAYMASVCCPHMKFDVSHF